MFRFLAFVFALASTALLQPVGASAEGYTTRIEPRPFYGAVVTLEEGVRVIRPLPPERQVIINPNNTPLSLGFNETNVYENRVVRHQYEGDAPRYGYRGGGGWPYGLGYGYGYGYGGNGRGKGYGKIRGVPGYAGAQGAGVGSGGGGHGSFKR